ncbi:hypothetical protein MAIT1_04542 [Magnetofaba australis IT-1]|uniref:Uncharacterized protein n=1 Tax=Magnetofaba australis IT-1 TaxID=1434232 RepID=A0A1Y2K9S2_9PROT|nr:hypothetical protein MAIT1_04542 [Magnetofaba australis IT-1]
MIPEWNVSEWTDIAIRMECLVEHVPGAKYKRAQEANKLINWNIRFFPIVSSVLHFLRRIVRFWRSPHCGPPSRLDAAIGKGKILFPNSWDCGVPEQNEPGLLHCVAIIILKHGLWKRFRRFMDGQEGNQRGMAHVQGGKQDQFTVLVGYSRKELSV